MSHIRAAAAAAAFLLTSATPLHAGNLAGTTATVGQGTVASHALTGADGAPVEIGVRFSAKALDAEHNDVNGDGAVALMGECLGDYDFLLALPADVFVQLNREPHGHPPEPWALPHFDIHFYTEPAAVLDAMRPGPCGFLMHCDDFERAGDSASTSPAS